jgi:hypothetical protein
VGDAREAARAAMLLRTLYSGVGECGKILGRCFGAFSIVYGGLCTVYLRVRPPLQLTVGSIEEVPQMCVCVCVCVRSMCVCVCVTSR